MRYFEGTVPVEILFPIVCNCHIPYFSLPMLTFGETQGSLR